MTDETRKEMLQMLDNIENEIHSKGKQADYKKVWDGFSAVLTTIINERNEDIERK